MLDQRTKSNSHRNVCVSVYFLIQFNLNSFTYWQHLLYQFICALTHTQSEKEKERETLVLIIFKFKWNWWFITHHSSAIVYTLLLEIFYSNCIVNCNHFCIQPLNNCRYMLPPTPHIDSKHIRLAALSSWWSEKTMTCFVISTQIQHKKKRLIYDSQMKQRDKQTKRILSFCKNHFV